MIVDIKFIKKVNEMVNEMEEEIESYHNYHNPRAKSKIKQVKYNSYIKNRIPDINDISLEWERDEYYNLKYTLKYWFAGKHYNIQQLIDYKLMNHFNEDKIINQFIKYIQDTHNLNPDIITTFTRHLFEKYNDNYIEPSRDRIKFTYKNNIIHFLLRELDNRKIELEIHLESSDIRINKPIKIDYLIYNTLLYFNNQISKEIPDMIKSIDFEIEKIEKESERIREEARKKKALKIQREHEFNDYIDLIEIYFNDMSKFSFERKENKFDFEFCRIIIVEKFMEILPRKSPRNKCFSKLKMNQDIDSEILSDYVKIILSQIEIIKKEQEDEH